MNTMTSYSSNNGTTGIWRAIVVKNMGDGTARVYIPSIHVGMNPFKAKVVTTKDENGEEKTEVEVTTELRGSSKEESPENEDQLENKTSGSSESKDSETSSNEDKTASLKVTAADNPNSSSEDTTSKEDSDTSSAETEQSEEITNNSDVDISKFPLAPICAWQVRTPLKEGDPVWVMFESGSIEFPVIVSQFGTILPEGSLQSAGSSGTNSSSTGGTPPTTGPYAGEGGWSPLVTYVKLSPNCTKPRGSAIDTITIHHMAGNLSVQACGECFQGTREASSNYGVDTDGNIGCYVEEQNRAWTSSSSANDDRAVTIEVANDNLTTWHVSDTALNTCIALCVDICKRNNISRINFTGDKSGNLTMHKWFAPTGCPGPYLETKFQYIADQINAQL